MAQQPNILFYFVDNLGYGELGCYGGGVLRGADTARIDAFAKEGVQLLNFAPEAQCTPSRSALMTGRHAIRSGTHSVSFGAHVGLVAWERTIGDILSDAGYDCALYGKWHIGNTPGRWPTDHGFDEWYGPPESYDEALWDNDPWYDPERDGVSYLLESVKGQADPTEKKQLTFDSKRNAGREYVDRAKDFIGRSVADDKPFFVHFNHPLMHLPNVAGDEYRGSSGNGDWADCLLELDGHFGELLDTLDEHGLAENTIVVFFGDNGNEEQLLHRGTGGYWDGSYFTGMEASLRTPCMFRYPGVVTPDVISNEIVHITDLFPTVLGWADCEVPDDRVIDGVDVRPFLEGSADTSGREGYLFWNGEKLYGVKWGNFKMAMVDQENFWDVASERPVPRIINLLTDPKEREPVNHQHLHTWTFRHFARLINQFQASVAKEPPIPLGAPLDHIPDGNG
jgi:arylsulfatase